MMLFTKFAEAKNKLDITRELLKDKRGQTGSQVIGAIILLSIAAIFVATIFLEALNILGGANTSNLSGATLVLFGLVSIILVLGIIILILKAVGIKVV